jgi:heptosyltransferase I
MMPRADRGRGKRVLILKASALGDVVHALPVLPYLKSVCPHVQIDWVVEAPFADLLRHHPMIHELHTLRTKSWRKSLSLRRTFDELGALHKALRTRKYDAVLDLQGNCKSGIIALTTGARLRYGFGPRFVREWPNLLASNRKVSLTSDVHHVTDRALLVASTAFPEGLRPVAAGPLFVEPESRKRVEYLFDTFGISGRRTALFHCGASWETKRWSVESWKELARLAAKQMDTQVIFTWGNENELAACRSICEGVAGSPLIWPRSSLREVVALMEKVNLVVAGDTGLVHIAAAVGAPTVSLFFVTDNSRNGPRGDTHRRVQSSMSCSPCLRKECRRKDQCRDSIGVRDVFSAILELAGAEILEKMR